VKKSRPSYCLKSLPHGRRQIFIGLETSKHGKHVDPKILTVRKNGYPQKVVENRFCYKTSVKPFCAKIG